MRIFKRKYGVYCAGCAYLFLMPGGAPQCLATADFVRGPIRSKIDVVGRVPAEKRNSNNDCPYRQPVSLRAWEMKRWILWRLSDGEDKLRERKIKEYPIQDEYRRTLKYRRGGIEQPQDHPKSDYAVECGEESTLEDTSFEEEIDGQED